jgi:hypothetical protein
VTRRAALVALVLGGLAASACSRAPSPAPSSASSPLAGSPVAGSPAADAGLTSPVVGLLTKLDSEGLTKVTGFRLRLDDGREIEFRIGLLENGAQFPPGHLAEHMATSSPVKAWFRDEGGAHVVYRLEDGPAK